LDVTNRAHAAAAKNSRIAVRNSGAVADDEVYRPTCVVFRRARQTR